MTDSAQAEWAKQSDRICNIFLCLASLLWCLPVPACVACNAGLLPAAFCCILVHACCPPLPLLHLHHCIFCIASRNVLPAASKPENGRTMNIAHAHTIVLALSNCLSLCVFVCLCVQLLLIQLSVCAGCLSACLPQLCPLFQRFVCQCVSQLTFIHSFTVAFHSHCTHK